MSPRHIRRLEVQIDGNDIPNVIDVEYGLDVRPSKINMSPSDARPRLKMIRLTRISDQSELFWEWSIKPFKGNFKSGMVNFYHPDEETQVMSTLMWENGFVTHYNETVPHIQKHQGEPQTETIYISAQKIAMNGIEIEADSWS